MAKKTIAKASPKKAAKDLKRAHAKDPFPKKTPVWEAAPSKRAPVENDIARGCATGLRKAQGMTAPSKGKAAMGKAATGKAATWEAAPPKGKSPTRAASSSTKSPVTAAPSKKMQAPSKKKITAASPKIEKTIPKKMKALSERTSPAPKKWPPVQPGDVSEEQMAGLVHKMPQVAPAQLGDVSKGQTAAGVHRRQSTAASNYYKTSSHKTEGTVVGGTDPCSCGDVPEEHGRDPRYPGSTSCNVPGCDCVAYEADPEAVEEDHGTREEDHGTREEDPGSSKGIHGDHAPDVTHGAEAPVSDEDASCRMETVSDEGASRRTVYDDVQLNAPESVNPQLSELPDAYFDAHAPEVLISDEEVPRFMGTAYKWNVTASELKGLGKDEVSALKALLSEEDSETCAKGPGSSEGERSGTCAKDPEDLP